MVIHGCCQVISYILNNAKLTCHLLPCVSIQLMDYLLFMFKYVQNPSGLLGILAKSVIKGILSGLAAGKLPVYKWFNFAEDFFGNSMFTFGKFGQGGFRECPGRFGSR